MTLTRFIAVPLVAVFTCIAAAAPAGPSSSADAPTVMAKRGKTILADDFERSELGTNWRQVIAKVTVKDGVLVGEELPEKMHAAVAKVSMPFNAIVADFDFRFDGGKGVNFGMDDKEYKGSHAGHIARAAFTPFGITLGDSKTGLMANEYHDNKDNPAYKEKIAAVKKATEATAKVKLEQGKWYHATVEVLGDEAVVSLDGKPVAYLKSPGLAHETKSMFGFTISGQVGLVDNVKVCEAQPDAGWSKRRAEMQAMMQAAASAPAAKAAPKGKAKGAKSK